MALHNNKHSATRSNSPLNRTRLATQIALALGGLATLLPTAATAQQADPAQLGTVTVTANRRVEDAQKVSVSVTAVTGATLAERNITDLSQMEGMSAGFTFGRSGSDARPAIRGVRTENVAVNGDTTIGYFVDGVYKSRAQQALSSFVDISRVEIQRGPQGTLFGRNTFGGNIVITSVAPELKSFETGASIGMGSYGKLRLEGLLNVPLADSAAVRIAAAMEKSDGWVKNDYNPAATLFDQDLKYLRASVKFKPSRELEAVFRADITEQRGNGGSAFGYKQAGSYYHTPSCQQLFNATQTTINPRGGNRDGVNDCTRTQGAGSGLTTNAIGTGVDQGIPIYAPGNVYRIDTDYQTKLNFSDKNASLDLSYRLPAFTLKSITSYANMSSTRDADSDMSASTIAVDQQKTAAKTITQEFQILSEGSGPISYVAGVYLFKDTLEGTLAQQQFPRVIRSGAITTPLSLPVQSTGFYDNQLPTTDSKAIYGQISFKATEALTATAGARYTRDRKSFKSANSAAALTTAPQIYLDTPLPADSVYGSAGTTNCTGSNAQPGYNCIPGTNTLIGLTYDDATFSKATGKLALDYKLNNDQLLYATVSTGFRSGGFNPGQAIASVRTFEPEEVTALEIGSKNRFFRNTLQVNLAAFQNSYTNLQEQRQVPIGTATISAIFNAAKAKSKGLEAEIEWRQSSALTLGGTMALLDAKYTSFPNVTLPFGTSILVANPASTTPQTDANGIVIAPAGQQRIFAPGYNCGVTPGTGGTGQPAASYGCDLSGKRLPYSPTYQGSVFAKYDIAVGGGTVTPMLAVNFSSGYYGQPTNAEIEKQGAYAKADFKLNWRINDKLSIQAYVDNITDKQTINRFTWGGGGALQVSGAPPRTFGLKLAYSNL